jgi:hypothetical protein
MEEIHDNWRLSNVKIKKKKLFVLFIVMILIVATDWFVQTYRRGLYNEKIYKQIDLFMKIGADRDDVIREMDKIGAWHHCILKYDTMIQDIYIFGERKRNHAIVWTIISDKGKDNGDVTIYSFGTISESMYLPNECSPPGFK